jgi:hypothetical protein
MKMGLGSTEIDPHEVAEAALSGIEANKEEVLVDEFTREVKRSLCTEQPIYLRFVGNRLNASFEIRLDGTWSPCQFRE